MPPQSTPPPIPYSNTTCANGTNLSLSPLSVYELPTATCMWAPWHPRVDSESESRMYVKYRSQMSDTDSTSTSSNSTYSLPHSRASYIMGSSQYSTPSSLSLSRKRGSSAESDHKASAPTSPSDRFLKLPRISYNNAPNKAPSACGAPPNVPSASASYSARYANKNATRVYHPTSSADSDLSDFELRPATFVYPGYQSNSSSSGGGAVVPRSFSPTAPVAPASAAPVQSQEEEEERKEEEEDGEDMKNAWIKYAYPSPELFAGPDFDCVWQEKLHDGTSRPCRYHSKKHVLRRHIESKHLQLRPCKCKYCGKGFSQKRNLDTHLNTHTGDTPHKCHYCDKHFGDPSRRHKHMIQVHQHRSSRTKKDRRGIDVRAGPSAEGSEHDTADLTTPAR